MKPLILLFAFSFVFFLNLTAQNNEADNITLFVDLVENTNKPLNTDQLLKLKNKTIQLVNKTGIANIGYSNFLVYPQIMIDEYRVSDAGMKNITGVEAELLIFVARTEFSALPGGPKKAQGIMDAYSQSISGSGSDSATALSNALSNINTSDPKIIAFIESAKVRIMDYYKNNCEEVMKEALRADEIQNNNYALSLLMSIPYGAPCYDVARKESIKIYKEYSNDICKKQQAELRSLITLAQDATQEQAQKYYDEALDIIRNKLNPETDCYNEVLNLMNSLDKKFTKEQEQQWQLIMQYLKNEKEVELATYKAMSDMARGYTPSNTIQITNSK